MMKLDDLAAEVSATRRLICAAADRAGQIAFVGGARHGGGPGGDSYSYASFASTVQAPAAGLPEEVGVWRFSRGQEGRLRPVPITHREFIDALDRADRTAGISDHDLVLAMPPTGDGLAYTTLVDCALLRGATVVVVRKQEIAMAAIAHQATAAIVPREAVASVPGKVRALPAS